MMRICPSSRTVSKHYRTPQNFCTVIVYLHILLMPTARYYTTCTIHICSHFRKNHLIWRQNVLCFPTKTSSSTILHYHRMNSNHLFWLITFSLRFIASSIPSFTGDLVLLSTLPKNLCQPSRFHLARYLQWSQEMTRTNFLTSTKQFQIPMEHLRATRKAKILISIVMVPARKGGLRT